MKVHDITNINGFKLINGSDITIDHFSISTNDIQGKTMFFPLKGKTDGHDYILNGVEGGIAGFFVAPGHDEIVKKAISIHNDIVIIEVKNPLKALQALASHVRNGLNIPVIGVTGSYGKTSQREMIYSVLKQEFNVLTTKGNLNNHIGMPLTLINYKDEDVVLLELGSNHMGEIAFLRDICRPTISLVTQIGTAHIGNFKSLRNTLKEKTSISKGSKYFLRNVDDTLLKLKKIKGPEIIDYGVSTDKISNIILGKKDRYTIEIDDKKYKVTINNDIEYLINYSIAAIKVGLLLGMDMKNIIKGIDEFRCESGRMEKIKHGRNVIINDCYNASYETMISGLDYFYKSNYKNKIVILGDILEQGRLSKKIHMSIAKYIVKNNLDFPEIHLVGKEMKNVYNYLNKKKYNVFYYPSVDDVNTDVLKNKCVYLKASNGIGLNKLIKTP